MSPVDNLVDNMGKTAESMGISLGISCGFGFILVVNIAFYQGFCCPMAVCRKYFRTFFWGWAISDFASSKACEKQKWR